MNIENITLTGNNKGVEFPVPLIPTIELNLNYIRVVKSFLEGTDSNEWLSQACYNVEKEHLVNECKKEIEKGKAILKDKEI